MDGKGRWADNIYIERFWRSIKYEALYLHSFETVPEARKELGNYIDFYNKQRPHQSLGYKTPDSIYMSNKSKFLKSGVVVEHLANKNNSTCQPAKGGPLIL